MGKVQFKKTLLEVVLEGNYVNDCVVGMNWFGYPVKQVELCVCDDQTKKHIKLHLTDINSMFPYKIKHRCVHPAWLLRILPKKIAMV